MVPAHCKVRTIAKHETTFKKFRVQVNKTQFQTITKNTNIVNVKINSYKYENDQNRSSYQQSKILVKK